MGLRIYLTGRMSLEHQGKLLDQDAFPSTQGLLAFARLAADRQHAVSRDTLAALLWPDKLPRAWEVSLSAVVSRLRSLLAKLGFKKSEVLSAALGCYQMNLPPDTWIDIEAASDGIHKAEVARKRRNYPELYGWAHVAYQIARRPFLAGEEGDWVNGEREKLSTLFLRSCECLADFYIWNGEPSLAIESAKQVVVREPFRETGYQLLMRAHQAAGNRAEALWVYEKCKKLIAEELGADPSPETKEVYLQILRSSRR
ncbi:MAG TPA: BTAD domain-containing putative transcriptional regulator [Planctomycetota bacterium]|nr:BTAD domain-containing putative transcriptional regulator [Planctomycetota bacterium]